MYNFDNNIIETLCSFLTIVAVVIHENPIHHSKHQFTQPGTKWKFAMNAEVSFTIDKHDRKW